MNETHPNEALVRSFVERFWNGKEVDSVGDFVTEDYTDHAYRPGDVNGLKHTAHTLNGAFPDQTSRLESIVAAGDRVVVRLTMTGTHKGDFRGKEATNRPIDVAVYREYRIENGKIAEHWALFDTATLLRQIGAELHEQPACRLDRPR
jgi:steroid delta-isomerase-like uncharacterized protein